MLCAPDRKARGADIVKSHRRQRGVVAADVSKRPQLRSASCEVHRRAVRGMRLSSREFDSGSGAPDALCKRSRRNPYHAISDDRPDPCGNVWRRS